MILLDMKDMQALIINIFELADEVSARTVTSTGRRLA